MTLMGRAGKYVLSEASRLDMVSCGDRGRKRGHLGGGLRETSGFLEAFVILLCIRAPPGGDLAMSGGTLGHYTALLASSGAEGREASEQPPTTLTPDVPEAHTKNPGW